MRPSPPSLLTIPRLGERRCAFQQHRLKPRNRRWLSSHDPLRQRPWSETSTPLRNRMALLPRRPRLKITPDQHGSERHKHRQHRCSHQHCIERHDGLLENRSHYPRPGNTVVDADQTRKRSRVREQFLVRLRPWPRRAPDPEGTRFRAGCRSLGRVPAW